MSARRNGFRDGTMSVIDQMLGREYLLGGDNIVVPCSKQKQRTMQLGQVDPAAQRDELSGGQAVLLEQLSNDLQVIRARQVHGPRVPIIETRLQATKWFRLHRICRLQ